MIHEIILQNFRNYKFRQFDFSPQVNFICGKNGAGKTNLLEAISLLDGSFGLRGFEAKALNYNFTLPFSLGFETEIGRISIQSSESGKKFLLEGDAIKTKHLSEKIKIIEIIPQDEFIFSERSSNRRIFFDKLFCKLSTNFEEALKNYKNLSSERIKALETGANNTWLQVIEEQMTKSYIQIAFFRIECIEKINKIITQGTHGISAKIILSGLVESSITSFTAAESFFANELFLARKIDAITGKTLTGKEKTNFEIIFLKTGVNSVNSSAGEQKRMLFIVCFAVIQILLQQNHPVLFLIDEVVCKLDEEGRESFLKYLQSLPIQSFLTGASDVLTGDINKIFI